MSSRIKRYNNILTKMKSKKIKTKNWTIKHKLNKRSKLLNRMIKLD